MGNDNDRHREAKRAFERLEQRRLDAKRDADRFEARRIEASRVEAKRLEKEQDRADEREEDRRREQRARERQTASMQTGDLNPPPGSRGSPGDAKNLADPSPSSSTNQDAIRAAQQVIGGALFLGGLAGLAWVASKVFKLVKGANLSPDSAANQDAGATQPPPNAPDPPKPA